MRSGWELRSASSAVASWLGASSIALRAEYVTGGSLARACEPAQAARAGGRALSKRRATSARRRARGALHHGRSAAGRGRTSRARAGAPPRAARARRLATGRPRLRLSRRASTELDWMSDAVLECVTRLDHEGREIYLVGTAHVSQRSVDD